jgi:hypothetical protein
MADLPENPTQDQLNEAYRSMLELTEHMEAEELEESLMAMAIWFVEALKVFVPDDPTSLVRWLGVKVAGESLTGS